MQRLRKVQDERKNQRDRIIADRVQQLLRDAVGLGWGDLGGDVAAVAQHDLIKAMQDFVDNWRIHREKLIDSVDGHQKAISTAADSYDQLDHDQASCLAQAGGKA